MNFNERIAELAALDRRVGYWDWGIDEQWDHHVLYDDGYAFSVCETESADALPTHAAFIVALRNKALPLLREMLQEIEYLKSEAQKTDKAFSETLKDLVITKRESKRFGNQVVLAVNKNCELQAENERLRAGIARAVEYLQHQFGYDDVLALEQEFRQISFGDVTEFMDFMKELEALQNDA